MAAQKLTEYLEAIPDCDTIRERLAENIKERELLRQLLRIKQKQEAVKARQEAAS